ncbi:potassium channel family protein [Microbacterium trichothecenolyticum]|uniref:potassium channel family protein n=1 Tax=Microbacterium trichothecenolyticum TaxID=69370 RepID=UPI0035BE3A83
MTHQSFADMSPRARRRAAWGVTGRVIATWAVFTVAYFLFPVGTYSIIDFALKLPLVILLVAGIILWQLRQITRATHPELRAVEALGCILAAFLVLFAALYLSMSYAAVATFTEPLDHMSALYFTVTVFATVGFGDISAKTDLGQAVVTIQMILDLVLIGAVARLLITAARTTLRRSPS